MYGEDEYRKSLDLDNDDAPVGKSQVRNPQHLLVGILCVSQQWIT